MKQEQSHAYAAACFHGEYASCSYACPFRLDVRSFLANIRKGSFQAAYRILSDTLIFPGIVTELCQEFCREHCVRRLNAQPLSILDLERACIRLVRSKNPLSYNIPQKNKEIAIIGAGLSGLACALRLAVKKYRVHVYEQDNNLGGALRTHEKFELFLAEIKQRIQNEAIEFHFNHRVDDISTLNCDAVYIATGKNGDHFGLLDGFNDKTLGTNKSRCFLGGMLAGASLLDSLEHGMRASKQIEKFLLTGDVQDYVEEYPYENCERLMQIDSLPDQPAVIPANPEGYTKDEAMKEASRCLKCDCSRCMKSCEMLQAFKKSPLKIVKEIYTDSIVLHGLSHRTLTREVASCNMCGQCKAVCPTAVDMGAAFLFARRDRVEQDNYPKAFHDYWLRQMDFAITEASAFLLPPEKKTCGYLFFPGCQLGSSNPQYVLASYKKLLELTGGDTGLMLSCCGAPAYWAGEVEKHNEALNLIRSFWEKSGKGTVICACMTCMKLIKEHCPEINTVSLYEILDTAQAPAVDFCGAIFDPCSSRYETEARASIRSLLKKMKVSAQELPFHDEAAKCCGWGGHIYPANPNLFKTIVENRISAAEYPYIVYCSNCRDVFAAKGKNCVHFLDLYFGLDSGNRPAPTVKEKHDNSLHLKQALLKTFWDQDYTIPALQGENMDLILTKQLADKLEDLLISQDLVRKAIHHAETSGEKFVDIDSGVQICSVREGMCTLWVHYKPAEQHETYEILNVYTHRMEILE